MFGNSSLQQPHDRLWCASEGLKHERACAREHAGSYNALDTLARWFLVAANVCLVLMLAGTATTIVLRPFDLSYYWFWPWTMQFFVWMCRQSSRREERTESRCP